MKLCPHCGANLALVGAAHRCIQRVPNVSPNRVASPNSVPNASPNVKGMTRNARWRLKHRDRYLAYMREYMRRYRAKTA